MQQKTKHMTNAVTKWSKLSWAASSAGRDIYLSSPEGERVAGFRLERSGEVTAQ